MNIELETLTLTRYLEEQHNNLKESFAKGSSSSKFIHQISERLEQFKNKTKSIFQSAFVVLDEETLLDIYIFQVHLKMKCF